MFGSEVNSYIDKLFAESVQIPGDSKVAYPSGSELIYKKLVQKALENQYSNNNKELSYRQKIVFSTLSPEQAFSEAFLAVKKAVLENTLNPYEVKGLLIYFYVPKTDNQKNIKLLNDTLAGLSKAAELFAVPVISTHAYFFGHEKTIPFLSLAVFSEKIEPSRNSGKKKQEYFSIYFVKGIRKALEESGQNMNDKLLKEAMLEFNHQDQTECYYSAGSVADLIADFFGQNGFHGFIDIGLIPECKKCHSFPEAFVCSSPEGFLLKAPSGNEKRIESLVHTWNLGYEKIGESYHGEPCIIGLGKEKIEITPSLIEQIIRSRPKTEIPVQPEVFPTFNPEQLELPLISNRELASKFISRPNVASKRWIKDQLERFAGINNLSVNRHTDTPILLHRPCDLINFVLTYHPDFFKFGFKSGLERSLLELLRRMAATSAEPLQALVCFIISNQARWEEINQVKRIAAEVAQSLSVELVVQMEFQNFHNSDGPAILPIISMTGNIGHADNVTEFNFKEKGDLIFLIGKSESSLSTEYLKTISDEEWTFQKPEPDVASELKGIRIVKELIGLKLVKSVHHVSENGLFASLVEACIPKRFGFDITTDTELRSDLFLYGSEGGKFIVSVSIQDEDSFIDYLVASDYPFTTLGHVTKEELRIDDISYGFISDIRKIYLKSLEHRIMNN
jgi:phosphoribosylformylglycinamidine synthase subunit PurL